MLRTCGGRPVVLQPLPYRYRDRADYWLSGTSARLRRPKKAIAALFRATDRLFGTVLSMNLDLAVRKEAEATAQRRMEAVRGAESTATRSHRHYRLNVKLLLAPTGYHIACRAMAYQGGDRAKKM